MSTQLPSALSAPIFIILVLVAGSADAQSDRVEAVGKVKEAGNFQEQVRPFLQKNCLRCHDAQTAEAGVRLDQLDGQLAGRRVFLWADIREQISEQAMPPKGEAQPTSAERRSFVQGVDEAIAQARARDRAKNGSVRRLTVAQYRNTIRDLLGLEDDLTGVLPPDGISKDGFANNGQSMLLSPLMVESFFNIAEQALDLCIVDERRRPVIQTFRMDLGEAINPQPCPDKLILGANSLLLDNRDFMVTGLSPDKPFDYEPFAMRTSYEFMEGYQGNATVRGLRKFNSIYHSVFACMRGSVGYPNGRAYQTIPEGLLLRPAIPSSEVFGESSTYGPHANFKLSLRELPDHGRFRVTVKAARYDDGLLLDANASPAEAVSVTSADLESAEPTVTVPRSGIYQVDVHYVPGRRPGVLSLQIGERRFSGTLFRPKSSQPRGSERTSAFMLVRLPAGSLELNAEHDQGGLVRRISLSRVAADSRQARQFETFERRSPILGVHLGLRRDCGSTLAPVAEPQTVAAREFAEFVFEGAIRNFPSPDVERNNVNYLAGFREIGVRSEFTDGRAMPRLLIRSVQFEGPFYDTWPPKTHRRIFIESVNRDDPASYAREVIRSFATRAYRRPVTEAEVESLFAVWQNSYSQSTDLQGSIKDALLVVLTSPQFLFLIERSNSPDADELDSFELASKLSYFLWNTGPDRRLLELAESNALHAALDKELDRMIGDPRFERFAQQFASQWFRLDKLDVVRIDRRRYPSFTREAKRHLRDEPVQYLRYLIEHDLPLRNLLQSDFIVANEVVAGYYGLADRTESGLRFVRVEHNDENLGGVLTQAGILAGLSDGRESNPVKRGAWLARSILADPPDDPPPNVPALMEDDGQQLTLRERLQRHREQKGCITCHSGIDPWGIPFETFNAGGLFKNDPGVDARSTLPDKTEVRDLNALKAYLASDRIDQVAFSFLKHLASYAVGRSLTYNEVAFLRERGLQLRARDYRMRDLIRFVVHSEVFLKK